MSCSLKDSKDMLMDFGIISKFHEIVNKDELQLFEENLMESVGEDAFNKAMGNPFFIQNFPDKSKLQFNKNFFKILDNLNDAKVFKSRILNESIETESAVSQENNNELNDVYSRIDAMIQSNEITITCKI